MVELQYKTLSPPKTLLRFYWVNGFYVYILISRDRSPPPLGEDDRVSGNGMRSSLAPICAKNRKGDSNLELPNAALAGAF